MTQIRRVKRTPKKLVHLSTWSALLKPVRASLKLFMRFRKLRLRRRRQLRRLDPVEVFLDDGLVRGLRMEICLCIPF